MADNEKNKASDKTPEKGAGFSSGFAERRRVLKTGLGMMCCAGAAEVGWPLFRYLTAREGGEVEPVIVPKDELPPGSSHSIDEGGWHAMMFNDGGKVVVLSKVCTHLGCIVTWNADKQQFHCACHDAHFDKDGRVLDGPPPRPLDRIPFKVDDDTYVIGVEPDEKKEAAAP